MSLTSSLQRIVTAKENIRQAIIAKGVQVSSEESITEYPTYISNIQASSGDTTLVTKYITQNGVYNASSDSADGYSEVVVDVPTGESGGDVVATVGVDRAYFLQEGTNHDSFKSLYMLPIKYSTDGVSSIALDSDNYNELTILG